MISGKTTLIAHLGFPTEAFKAPMIYNPWFDKQGIDAVVVPMGVKPEDYAASLPQIFKFSNLRGALVTMPHKVTTMALVDEVTPTARVAGACNAILKRPDGTLIVGDTHYRGHAVAPFQEERSFEYLLELNEQLLGRRARVLQRWQGVYATAPQEFLLADLAPGVRVASVTTGIGMTTGLGFAAHAVAGLL